MQSSVIFPDEVNFQFVGTESVYNSNGEILKIIFKANDNSKAGEASLLTLSNISLFDSDNKEIVVKSITDGAFIVNRINGGIHCIYVDANNSGDEDGSIYKPFKTIMKGIDKSSSGDSIIVAGGNYNETIIMKEGVFLLGSGASVTNLVLAGEQSGVLFNNINNAEISGFNIETTIDHFSAPLISCEASSPTIIKNRIKGSPYKDEAVHIWNGSNAIIADNYFINTWITVLESDPIIKNNKIESESFSGLNIYNGSSPLITNNNIRGSFMVRNSSPTIRNNHITCIAADPFGIMLNKTSNAKIFNNIINDKTNFGTGIKILESQDIDIVNNTIVTHGRGIEEIASSANIYNNIITGNNDFGILKSSTSFMNYNNVWNNIIDYKDISPGMNDISKDPFFIDAEKGNYRLANNSACIDAGNPDFVFNDLNGSRNDIGAYGGSYADSVWILSDCKSLALDSLTASSSDTIAVKIKGKNIKGIAEVDIKLSYDSTLLKMIKANTGELTKSFSLQKEIYDNNLVRLNLKSSCGINDDNGELVILYFVINVNQSVNTQIQFDSAKVKLEATQQEYIFNLANGQINIIRTDIDDKNESQLPQEYSLSQNYPNPFNPITKISYNVPSESKVTIKIYDILGREISTLIEGIQKPGNYEVSWDASKFASGVYLYSMKSDGAYFTRKMLLLK